MQLLVFGGTSFAAQSFLKRLALKHNLTVVSRSKKSVSDRKIKYIVADICNFRQLDKALTDIHFDRIIHFAAFAPKDPFLDPDLSMRVNVVGTQNIVMIAKKYQVKQIVFASTFSVYGSGSDDPISENAKTKPINPYSISKLWAEEILINLARENDVDVVILRFAGLFGGNRRDGAIYNFVKNSLSSFDIFVTNPFNYTDMLYVKDVSALMEKSFKYMGMGIFNISSGEKYTTFQLAQLVSKHTNSHSKIIVESQDVHEALQLHLNIEKASNLLGFIPTKIEDAVDEMISDFS